jgi:hypothetical protein
LKGKRYDLNELRSLVYADYDELISQKYYDADDLIALIFRFLQNQSYTYTHHANSG